MNDRRDNPARIGNRGGSRFRRVQKSERRRLLMLYRPKWCRTCREYTRQGSVNGVRTCRACGGEKFGNTAKWRKAA